MTPDVSGYRVPGSPGIPSLIISMLPAMPDLNGSCLRLSHGLFHPARLVRIVYNQFSPRGQVRATHHSK
ncbi:hypothetical protein ES708_03953 [subsurface metagenome]